MVACGHHLANAVHAEHGFADIDRRNPEVCRYRRTDRTSAWHVVTRNENLERDPRLFAEQAELGRTHQVARITLLGVRLQHNAFA